MEVVGNLKHNLLSAIWAGQAAVVCGWSQHFQMADDVLGPEMDMG